MEAGIRVTLVGRSEEKVQAARARVNAGLARLSKRRYPNDAPTQQQFVQAALSNLQLAADLALADLQKADIVIEAVVEDLKLKQELFHELEQSTSR